MYNVLFGMMHIIDGIIVNKFIPLIPYEFYYSFPKDMLYYISIVVASVITDIIYFKFINRKKYKVYNYIVFFAAGIVITYTSSFVYMLLSWFITFKDF